MCYLYSNWSGSIKILSIVQSALKTVESLKNLTEKRNKKNIKKLFKKNLALKPNMASRLYFL